MKNYELTVVLDGKATAARKKKVVETISDIVTVFKGKLAKTDDWGEKELAGKIGNSDTGIFLHFLLELEADCVKNLMTKLSQETGIIRFLLVKKD